MVSKAYSTIVGEGVPKYRIQLIQEHFEVFKAYRSWGLRSDLATKLGGMREPDETESLEDPPQWASEGMSSSSHTTSMATSVSTTLLNTIDEPHRVEIQRPSAPPPLGVNPLPGWNLGTPEANLSYCHEVQIDCRSQVIGVSQPF